MNSISSIMSNVYGADSPQSFEGVSLTGGSSFTFTQKQPSIMYIDGGDEKPVSDSYSMSGGARKKTKKQVKCIRTKGGADKDSSKDWPEYANGTHVPDDTFKKFADVFCLNWSLCNARYNSIWVCESDKVVDKYCKEMLDNLKKENLTPGSKEASKYITRNNARCNKCIFDVFAQNPPNNANMPYHVDNDFPLHTNNEVLRRTNRAGQIAYFKFNSANDIQCSDNQEFANDPANGQYTTKLKLLAKCQQAVFILKGDLPESIINNTVQSSLSKKALNDMAIYTMTGGSKNNNNKIKNDFLHEFNACGKDIDRAAYNYFAKQVLSAIQAGTSVDAAINKYKKYYSGDHVYTAINLLADKETNLFPINNLDQLDQSDIEKLHEMFVDKMNLEPSKANSIGKVKQLINNFYRFASKSSNPSSTMIKKLANLYTSSSRMAADIITPYLKRNSTVNGINNAFNIMHAIDEANDSSSLPQEAFNTVLNAVDGHTSALNDIVVDSLVDSTIGPMSLGAFSNPPMLYHSNKETFSILGARSQPKSKQHSMKGGDDTPEQQPPKEQPPKEQPKEESSPTEEQPPSNGFGYEGFNDYSDSDGYEAEDSLLKQFNEFTY